MPSGTNSHSGSLGASISDLSSEAPSEFSDNFNVTQQKTNSILTPVSIQTSSTNKTTSSITKTTNGNSGTSTSTPIKNSNVNSRLPVPKKN
jgi:hypothetical protein